MTNSYRVLCIKASVRGLFKEKKFLKRLESTLFEKAHYKSSSDRNESKLLFKKRH